jgi:hypothetical protein
MTIHKKLEGKRERERNRENVKTKMKICQKKFSASFTLFNFIYIFTPVKVKEKRDEMR